MVFWNYDFHIVFMFAHASGPKSGELHCYVIEYYSMEGLPQKRSLGILFQRDRYEARFGENDVVSVSCHRERAPPDHDASERLDYLEYACRVGLAIC